MSITDELRAVAAKTECANGRCEKLYRGDLDRIADRIDAEHESEISRAAQLLADAEKDRDFNYANWQDCKQRVLQHNITIDELDAEIERLKDELAHCIKLPKDADGEPIHVDDWIINPDISNQKHKVAAITPESVYWWGEDGCHWRYSHLVRHYHAPTVEDVLQEFVDQYAFYKQVEKGIHPDLESHKEVLRRFAAKLRLADE